MLLEEMQELLKKETVETQEQLWGINSLYILLDLSKEDFCKIVDTIGLEKLLSRRQRYDRLDRAERELSSKERYIRAKEKLDELNMEKESLKPLVIQYEQSMQKLFEYKPTEGACNATCAQ